MVTVPVVDADEVRPEHETHLSVAVVSGTVERHRPATVRIRLANESDDEREYVAGDGFRPVFSGIESRNRNPGLALATREEARERGVDPDGLPDDCRLDSVSTAGYLAARTVRLASGESAAVDLEVYGHPGNDGRRLPAGTFRFEERYEYRNWKDGDSKSAFDWGFSLPVEA